MSVAANLSLSQLERRVEQAIPETENLVMTLAEQLIQQGFAKRFAKGFAQGRLVRRQLELKFGALSAEVLSSLESADEPKIERYAERLITATSLAEVLSD